VAAVEVVTQATAPVDQVVAVLDTVAVVLAQQELSTQVAVEEDVTQVAQVEQAEKVLSF
jgi:hypothetical protein